MNRRHFVKSTGLIAAFSSLPAHTWLMASTKESKLIKIKSVRSNFEREKLLRPFGFKGNYLTELWQTAVELTSESGNKSFGLGTQSVLYGDADLFASCSEVTGNDMMYQLTKRALQCVQQTPFEDPIDLLEKIFAPVTDAAHEIAGRKNINPNFIYNALVSVDNAAWMAYAAENGINSFDALIPDCYKSSLSARQKKIAVMYQIPYAMPMKELVSASELGYFVFKIKAGFPGNQEEMLRGDIGRLSLIHDTLKHKQTDHTANGKLTYTIDANGRYEKKETLMRYLDHAKKIGAFDQIQLFEEPFVESNNDFVNDTGIRIAADESVHTEQDAIKRLEQGYSALVLKGIAKTLSQSMKIARLAHQRKVITICADLTVNPILIDWHKNLCCRLQSFPGIDMPMMETNGDMNYVRWKEMVRFHPMYQAPWTKAKNGVFELDDDFYRNSGGIFQSSAHYQELLAKPDK